MASGRRRDAALAAIALALTLVAAARLEAPRSLAAVAAGAAGTLALEALLSLRSERVRAVWSRPTVQVGSVVGVGVAAAAGVELVGAAVLTALVSGLVTYLLVLGLAAAADCRPET